MNTPWLHAMRWWSFCTLFLVVAGGLVTAEAPQPMPVMVGFTVAHVATGALTLASSIILAIQVFRHVQRPLAQLQPQGVAVPSA